MPFTAPYKRLRSQDLLRHLQPRRFCGRCERPFKVEVDFASLEIGRTIRDLCLTGLFGFKEYNII
ncbi:hypothetical protein PanWU01x14_145100 [Parasponia andersonii]|uniref:Uncharacterized protein n=1 Tax=Parasponia andersonii TaxID=3476 RepID=A0A2P5CKN2_PARAD|nr:hypothetical protein PanWU01x14_145100 [Parasponia andersonii]